MYDIDVDIIDGKKVHLEATGWHKKDDYLWISTNGDLVLIPLINAATIRIRTRKCNEDKTDSMPVSSNWLFGAGDPIITHS